MRNLISIIVLMLSLLSAGAQSKKAVDPMREKNPEFFATDEARRIGDQLLIFQRVTGGWPKNIDMVSPLTDESRQVAERNKSRRDDSTIDNNATTMQLTYLARLYQATKDKRYAEAFRKGVEFLFNGQYVTNGGWPQIWPVSASYHQHVTYNDGAMVHVMQFMRDLSEEREPYDGDIVDGYMRRRADESFDRGVECILNTQIYTRGVPTIWCQQYDKDKLMPAYARPYELPSYCPMESTGIVELLMDIPDPDKQIKKAVHGAMAWFDKYKITGVKVVRTGKKNTPEYNTILVNDSTATPIWARFYDLEKCEPFVCDRDGVPRRRLEDISAERRNGYAWYANSPLRLFKKYNEWADKFDPEGKVKISLTSKGANETGLINLNKIPRKQARFFDVVVKSGENIQAAIEKAPAQSNEPFYILISKGLYNQKVVIDRPNIVLVGEDRDSTIIQMPLLNAKPVFTEYKGKKLNYGVVELLEGADDCIISGLTIYNNYGSTVEPTTAQQMAVYGRATRTIITNCNIWSDGDDALALWSANNNGLYYHADLSVRCAGVDAICPRGWCYATRCHFYGDGQAILWHDGRGNPSQKLVVANSSFDAKKPTPLGQFHHDAQFVIVNSTMSKNILDRDITYAHTSKKEDQCSWGKRTYYARCTREGGNSGWLQDNLSNIQGNPEHYQITSKWVFGDKWNPEKRILDMWKVLEY